MPFALSPQLQAEIDAEVAAGRAKDPVSLVEAAVRGHLRRAKAMRDSLDEAEADFRTLGGVEHDALWAELLADLDQPV